MHSFALETTGKLNNMSDKPQQVTAEAPSRTTSDLVKAAVSGWLGTALEFMDFQLYSLAAALVFKDLFFPEGHPTMAILGAMAIYGVGYIARPLGAWYFGRMGDRVGRTKVLFITIAMMGVATTLIGFLPTYSQVGILAPTLLVILRLVQGFGAGAEIAGAAVMLAEYAPSNQRGIISSLVALGTNSGTLGAGLIWAIMLGTMGSDTVIAWGWRIPFIASAVLMGLAVFIRLHLKETPVFEATQEGIILSDEELVSEYDKPLASRAERKAELKEQQAADHKAIEEQLQKTPKSIKAFLAASVLRFGQSGNSGIMQTYIITFLTAEVLLAKSVASNIVVYSSIVGFLTVPVIGWIGDRIGRERTYRLITGIGILLIIPCFLGLVSPQFLGTETVMEKGVAHYSAPTLIFFISYIVLHNITVLAMFSLENITMAECFGSAHRYEQLALSKEIPNMITAGFGPLIAAALVAHFNSWIPLAIMMFVYTVAVHITAWMMPEITGRDLSVREDAF